MFETVKPESKRSFLSSNFSFWMMDGFFIILLRFLIWNSVGRHDMWKKKEKFTSFFKWKKYIYWENFFFRKYHSHRNSWKRQSETAFLISNFSFWVMNGFFIILLRFLIWNSVGRSSMWKKNPTSFFQSKKFVFTEKNFWKMLFT